MDSEQLDQNEDSQMRVDTFEPTEELTRKYCGQLYIFCNRFIRNRIAVVGLLILFIMSLAAILAPIITGTRPSYDPTTTINLQLKLHGPLPGHPLGTDDLGRDELARLLFGARVSLIVGLISMLVAILVGVLIGALAGFYGGWLDNLLMRLTDVFLAIPIYMILFVISASFSNGSIQSVVLLIASFSWMSTARIVRGEFLTLKEREFVMAARASGSRDLRIMLLHILPNTLGTIIVSATLLVGNNIITESALSFFNFGLQLPQASWGTLLASSQDYFVDDPILVWAPGLCILITVLAFNFVGDGLRDAFDPYMVEH